VKHSPETIQKVKFLKKQGVSDRLVAQELGLTIHQIHYIREKHRLGRYANYVND
jgi:5-bromo-4-chloroindolyl phosphate hydrolysis protein